VRLSASLEPEDSTWVIEVDEGERARIGRAAIEGVVSHPRGETLERLGLIEGSTFRPGDLAARIHDLLEEYDREGHPFAQVWIDSLGFDAAENRVDVRLYVVEGVEGNVEDVSVEGLKKTRPELAVRIAGVEPGTRYTGSLLRDARVRLSASGVFTSVQPPTVRMSADGRGVDVVLVVSEPSRSHSLTSALGYAEAEGEQERQISGMVDLRLNNIGGTLKDLGALWSNDGRDRVETRIDYTDQFFLGRRVSLGVNLHQIGLDTVYTWQSLGFEVERPVGRLAGSLVGVSLGVNGDRNVFSVGELKRSWRLRTTLGARYRRGVIDGNVFSARARMGVAWKRRVLREGGDESLNQYIPEVEVEAAVRLRPVIHARTALVYRGLESSERIVPLSEVFYIGGARTLRGYKESQFNGRRVATARNELLLGRTRVENVYLFADVGYVLRETLTAADTVDRDEIVRAGYGFGLRTASRLGNVDLSFGVGEKLSLQQTKVHVLLVQSF
jgi:outer membrane protein assembly factor BamA